MARLGARREVRSGILGGGVTQRIWKSLVASTIGLGLVFAAAGAQAQSIFGFEVGGDFRTQAKTHPQPSDVGEAGPYAVVRWNLAGGDQVSVTSSAATGKIVFIESDWGENAADAATDIPGLTFGTTTLADIRSRFGSNGFGFKSNVVNVIDKNIVSFNCYQVGGDGDQVAVFVTTLPMSSVPIVDGEPAPKLGEGRLDSVILASLAYLKEIWGEDRISDPGYRPITLK